MKRPDRDNFDSSVRFMNAQDKYIDHLESQLKEKDVIISEYHAKMIADKESYFEVVEAHDELESQLKLYKPLADEYMNDYLKCDICGNHPSTIIRTNKGTFCQEHAKY